MSHGNKFKRKRKTMNGLIYVVWTLKVLKQNVLPFLINYIGEW